MNEWIKIRKELNLEMLFLQHLVDVNRDSEGSGIGVTCYMQYEDCIKKFEPNKKNKGNTYECLKALHFEGYIGFDPPIGEVFSPNQSIAILPEGKRYLRKLKIEYYLAGKNVINTIAFLVLGTIIGYLLGG